MFLWFLLGFAMARFCRETPVSRVFAAFALATLIAGGLLLGTSVEFDEHLANWANLWVQPVVQSLCHTDERGLPCMAIVLTMARPFVYATKLLGAALYVALVGIGLIPLK